MGIEDHEPQAQSQYLELNSDFYRVCRQGWPAWSLSLKESDVARSLMPFQQLDAVRAYSHG